MQPKSRANHARRTRRSPDEHHSHDTAPRRRCAVGHGRGGIVDVLAAPTALAAPVDCRAPGEAEVINADGTSECAAASVPGGAAAAYGIEGWALAEAVPGRSPSRSGATADGRRAPRPGAPRPRRSAMGPESSVTLAGSGLELTLGLAGAGATVTSDGAGNYSCSGRARVRRQPAHVAGLHVAGLRLSGRGAVLPRRRPPARSAAHEVAGLEVGALVDSLRR